LGKFKKAENGKQKAEIPQKPALISAFPLSAFCF
jgi:hypothetical protein